MGILSDLLGRAKNALGFSDNKPPPAAEVNAIESTSFDRDAWHRVLSESGGWQREAIRLGQTHQGVDNLLEDLHSALYKVAPRMRPVDEMAETHITNHQVISELVKLPEVEHLRQYSAGDAYASAVAMHSLQGALTESLQHVQEATEQAGQRKADAERKAQEAAERLQEMIEAAQQAQANGSPIEQEIAEENLQAAQDDHSIRCGALQAAADQFAEEAKDASRGEVKSLRAAAQDVVDKLDEEAALMSAYGVDAGELERMSPEERMAIAERLRNDRLAQWAKKLGAFRPVQQAESRKRVTNASDQIVGIELSDNLARLVGSEYTNLAHPVLKAQLMVRFDQHRLLTTKTRGRAKGAQGPIIVLGDESGSMGIEDVGGASREAWSKGFALALLDQARRRDRDFIYIGFADKQEQHLIEFPKGATTLDKVLEMTSSFYRGGGTDFEKPLTMALDIIEKYASAGKPRPDIVMLTDGQSAVSDAFLKRYREVKRRASITTYGVAIGVSSRGTLEKISDNVREITEFVNDPSEVGDIFTTV